jgi:amidase
LSDIAFSPATKLARMVRQKKIGCLELLEHYLSRVEKYNPAINAVVVTDVPGARKRARAADRALKNGDIWGPFHGVPMTVKESFQVTGLPTTWGVPTFKDNIATKNALAVDRWLNAGAVIFGKTNLPVMLADGQSYNPVYGATNNPRDLKRTPGGSSGGSAAAVAAGLAGIEMGSDIASSIRNPAHNNGIFGHKPTFGLAPTRGHSIGDTLYPADISVIGPLARSAVDLEPALNVIAGPDEIEASAMKIALPPPRRKTLKDFKIGFMLSDPVSDVDREVQDVLQGLVDFLGKKKAKISDRAKPDIELASVDRLFALLLAAATGGREPDAQFQEKLKTTKTLDASDDSHAARMLRGATLYHRDWQALNEERTRLRWKWHEWFKTYDVMLLPVFPLAPFPHVHDVPSDVRTYQVNGRTVTHAHLLFWAGLTGVAYLPATAAPAGFTKSGLPVGVQIVGPHYGDRTTIHFAKLLEQEFQGFVAPKGYA